MPTPGGPKPLTFFTLGERVLGWVSVVLFITIFPVFVTWLFVSPRHGLGASWKPAAMSAATVVLLSTGGAFVGCGLLYSASKARSRRVLVARGWLACLYCGYDLRGATLPGACPECGERVVEAAAVVEHWRRQYPEGDVNLSKRSGPSPSLRSGVGERG